MHFGFLFDPLYLVVILLTAGLGGLASLKVKRAFTRYARVGNRRQYSGAQIATMILSYHGIGDVTVEATSGKLSDHYDPGKKVLRLSPDVYAGRSVAAAGIAAHEVGHAIQDAQGYMPLRFRSAWVPVATLGSKLSWIVLLLAILLGGMGSALGANLAILGVALFGATTLFTLITLPVEFDASRRAMLALAQGGILDSDELAGAKKVLSAAALTYVAAFVGSLLTLLYYALRLGLLGGGSRD